MIFELIYRFKLKIAPYYSALKRETESINYKKLKVIMNRVKKKIIGKCCKCNKLHIQKEFIGAYDLVLCNKCYNELNNKNNDLNTELDDTILQINLNFKENTCISTNTNNELNNSSYPHLNEIETVAIRLKKNVDTIKDPLKKVLSLRGVTYNWKDSTVPRRMMGMIAQEVLPIVPELVYQNKNDGYGIQYNRPNAASNIPAWMFNYYRNF